MTCIHLMYRSSVRPVGTSTLGYWSAARPGTSNPELVTTRSGSSPNTQVFAGGNMRGAGASAGLPFGAPLSTHLVMVAIWASLSDGSGSYSPTVRSICHGGIYRVTTFSLIERAHGRV